VAVTGWFALDTLSALPATPFDDGTRGWRGSRPARFALVTSWQEERFRPETVRALAAAPARLDAAADSLARLVRAGRYDGVVLDLEGHEPADSAALRAAAIALARGARAGGARTVALAVPAEPGAYADPALLAVADRVLVMLYDEHWSGSAPGPIASPAFVDAALARWRASLPAERLVAALPLYGYLWRNAAPGTVLSHTEFRALEREAGRPAGRDPVTEELVLELPGGGTAWYVDGRALNLLRTVVNRYDIGVVALWRMGLGEPMLEVGRQGVE
jgi:spore germination protein YaaH